ncbi:MAG TPA: SRPBCC domain-containing protein, partial [Actinomycetota bacterium]|nr:SRPBCC domain-containing protein [Actinomycetota bacterium]
PPSHSMTSAPGLVVTFESRPGGRIYERTPDGTEHDWGEVLTWEPPRRLAYLWHLGSDRSRATEVDISFTGDVTATTVTIVHRGWERLGADAAAWRQRNLGGWGGLLPHYREAVAA